MKIVKLILVDYNLLFLNNISRVEFNPTKKINLVLGTNGSGKSSLLKETSPLVFDVKHFGENGYKEVHIEHNNRFYITTQLGKKCSFKENGKELNTSGNRRVQATLVKEILKYDMESHKLFLGISNITTMSPNERKEWLIRLSHVDYDYSLAYYRRLLSRERDIKGSVKILSSKLLEDKVNLLTDEVKTKYKEDLRVINILIDNALENKETVTFRDVDYNHILNTLETANKTLLNRITTKVVLSKIDDAIATVSAEIKNIEEQNVIYIKQLEQAKIFRKENVDTLDKIKKERDTIVLKFTKTSKAISSKTNLTNLQTTLGIIGNIKEKIFSILSDISTTNVNLTLEESIENNKQLLNLDRLKAELEIKILKLENELEISISKKDESVTCNKCSNVFNPYHSEEKEKEMVANITKFKSAIKEVEKKKSDLEFIVNLYNTKQNLVAEFYRIVSMDDNVKNLIDTVLMKNNIQTASMLVMREIDYEHTVLLQQYKEYEELESRLYTLEKEIFSLETFMERSANQDTTLDFEKLSEIISVNNNKINTLTKNLNDLKVDKEVKNNLKILNTKYYALLKSKDAALSNELAKMKNELLEDVIKELRVFKFDLEDKIKKSDILEDRLKVLEKDIKELENKSRLLKIAIEALSPSEGLIADSILSFIKGLVSDMNYIINSIWSYSLEIKSCDLANGELDYKFPVVSDNRGNTEDIGLTSSSMKEVIDLAFKIIAMKYSDMEDYPLFLDEFGKTMDMGHRVQSYRAIDNISETLFSQVFIVSHFSGVYNRFSDADTIVLDSKNISLDNKEYNQNIIITRDE